ncbi:MAG: addiction module toxin RelE [Marinilabiliaceae bacterium]|nr:addiction module toxin RelE [Marinilabiliaceae bacterium]
MPNKISYTPLFETRCKRFLKKFPSLHSELEQLENDLIQNPLLGTHLGSNLYKIRLASKDKGKGKSGGFRVITYLVDETIESFEIFLVIIYDKSEESSIKKPLLLKLIKDIFE